MKKKTVTCLILTVLILVSAFFSVTLSTATESIGASEVSADQPETEDWPMFHHNTANTGNSESTVPKTNQTLWKFNTGGPVDSPVVSDGVVYFGSLDDKVYALNTTTGEYIWSYTTDGNVLSPAAVAEGMVYVGSEDFNVYALNASTGEYVWSYKTGYFVDSAIAYSEGVIYVGSEDYNVYALNASTGEYIWSYATGDQIMISSPIVAYGMVYIGSVDNKIHALNASTGAYIWSYTTGDDVVSTPAVADGKVYIG
jgi:outer membrane protein assembly factor BamB